MHGGDGERAGDGEAAPGGEADPGAGLARPSVARALALGGVLAVAFPLLELNQGSDRVSPGMWTWVLGAPAAVLALVASARPAVALLVGEPRRARWLAATALRPAVLGAAVLLALGLALVVPFTLRHERVWSASEDVAPLALALLGLSVGLASAPVAAVERLAARRPAPPSRDLAAALLAGLLGAFGTGGSVVQVLYTGAVAGGRGWAGSRAAAVSGVSWFLQHSAGSAVILTAAAVPFAALVRARLRGHGLARQTAEVLAACGALSLPVLAIARREFLPMDRVGALLAGLALALPATAALGEVLEQRLEGWLARREPPFALDRLARPWASLGLGAATILLAAGLVLASRQLLPERDVPYFPSLDAPTPAREPVAWDPAVAPLVARLAASQTSPAETEALLARLVELEVEARPRLRPGDPLHVRRMLHLHAPPGITLELTSRTYLDGKELDPSDDHRDGRQGASPPDIYEEMGDVLATVPALAAGAHELVVRSEAELSGPTDGDFLRWKGTLERRVAIEVAADVPAPVELVRTDAPCALIVPEQDARWGLAVRFDPRPLPISGRLEVLASDGTLLGNTNVFIEGEWAYGTARVRILPPLSPGVHELRVRFTPDVRPAIRESGAVRRVYGNELETSVRASIW